MSKSTALVCLVVMALGFSIVSYAAVADRVNGPLSGGAMVAVRGNVHGLAKPENDLGRADSSRLIQGISLAFHPSAAQQKDLDNFLRDLGDRTSPNYHKYLTPKQFGARFGMSQNDIDKVTAWLQSEGFTNIKVSNSRNYLSFDGTVGQIESVFKVEMRNYLVDGVIHLANAGEPLVPGPLADSILNVGHLHDFAPKPRAKVKSNLTSYVSGNHFLSPADFATIYNLQPLYSAGIDGTGQKIAIVGQSTVSTTDLNNFRSAAGLPPSTVTMTLAGGTATRCSGDEGESDLDLEWAGGVAKGASIIFVYAGLTTGDSCNGNRNNSVWDALQYAVDHNVAPFISISYGYCESGLGAAFGGLNGTVQGWAKQAQTQGQTITSATGDAGAADCDNGTTATHGFAVDVPASIPEVTGAGGSEFTGDTAGVVTGNQAAGDPPYWSGSGAGSDTVSSALQYIPEMAWNDTTADIAAGGGLSASGGGASAFAAGFFAKPSWQTGTGVPNDGARDVPDISVTASADHDGYLVCSEDSTNGQCAAGFRSTAGGNFAIVGGTSAAAPTFSAIMALINQYLGNVPPTGLAPLNPTLYSMAANNASTAAFHDVTTGNNKVPCTSGTTNCPSGTTEIGFNAGAGYDQVTGLGSVDANKFALAWAATRSATTTTISPSTTSSYVGSSVVFTATVTPSTTTGVVNFYNNGSTTPLGQATLSGGTAALTTTALPVGTNSVTSTFNGNTTSGSSTSAAPAVVSVAIPFTLAANPTSVAVTAGHSGSATITVTPLNGFALPLTFSCSSLTGVTCTFTPNNTTQASVSLSIATLPSMAASSTPITITATSGGSNAATNTTQLTLTVSNTDQTFTLAADATQYSVTPGSNATAKITLTGTNGFNTPVTYTCTDTASESTCTGPAGAVSSSTAASFVITTTAPTARLHRPMDRSKGIFFATLLPAFLGIVFTVGSVRRRSLRFLGMMLLLAFSTLWIASCGGSSGSGNKNPGTPAGTYTITVNATTGGANPVTGQTTFNLVVQ